MLSKLCVAVAQLSDAGIASAWRDGVPMIIITSQVRPKIFGAHAIYNCCWVHM
jgi:thiamine pyrophosphate-dependent acetolactate synthase large subunit-like protein